MCVAVACPVLTVLHSNTSELAGNTTDTCLVACDDGYNSSIGITFTASCDGITPGVSNWSNQLTCEGTTIVDVADELFESETKESLLTQIDMLAYVVCAAVACPQLTVNNSDTSELFGNTSDTRLVTCDDGYNSSSGSGINFTASCDGTAPGVSEWSNQLTCGVLL